MWNLLRQTLLKDFRQTRPYSQKTLTPSELRFKAKLEEADRKRLKHAPEWEKREHSLRKRYGTWNPTHKLSRQQMNDIRDLKARAPELKTVQIADFFKINPEGIRRILKSNWVPSERERADQEARGQKRKLESLQRKLAEKEALRKTGYPTKPSRPVSDFVKKRENSGDTRKFKYTRKGSSSYSAASSSSENAALHRSRKPFTQGVGDLID